MHYGDLLDEGQLREYVRSINGRAQALRKPGRIALDELRDRILESGGRCEWCAASLLRKPFELDHIVSLGSGGRNSADNLAVACPACNRAKAGKHPARFAQETVARTGLRTALIERVLAAYGADASVQRSLFEERPSAAPRPTDDAPDDEPPPDEPPPYVWGRRDS